MTIHWLPSYRQLFLTVTYSNRQVKNSYELYETLSDKKICETHILISLDVISPFVNIPQDLAIESILNRWTLIEKNTNIPKDDFIVAIK